jgi:hypothetical protein
VKERCVIGRAINVMDVAAERSVQRKLDNFHELSAQG